MYFAICLILTLLILKYNVCYFNWVLPSKEDGEIKRNKNHQRHKMFRLGLSFCKNEINLEGYVQMGYNSKTIKNYIDVPKLEIPKSLSQLDGPPEVRGMKKNETNGTNS